MIIDNKYEFFTFLDTSIAVMIIPITASIISFVNSLKKIRLALLRTEDRFKKILINLPSACRETPQRFAPASDPLQPWGWYFHPSAASHNP